MSLLNHNLPQATSGNFQQLKNLYGMMQNAQNPQAFLQNLARQNPQLQQVMQMCNSTNPRDVFYALCKQKGVNPDEILNQLK